MFQSERTFFLLVGLKTVSSFKHERCDLQNNFGQLHDNENSYIKRNFFYHLQDLITLTQEDNAVVEELFKDMESKYNHEKQEDFKSLFVQQQKKALMCSDSRARRWHPLIIRWCFHFIPHLPRLINYSKRVEC